MVSRNCCQNALDYSFVSLFTPDRLDQYLHQTLPVPKPTTRHLEIKSGVNIIVLNTYTNQIHFGTVLLRLWPFRNTSEINLVQL